MAREYEIAGESRALYNGVQDTEGGIWLRIRDETDRRILAAAVDKQLKNQQAASGTAVALDPNAGHVFDYVADSLNRTKEALNGARPSSAQLDGTPLGAAIAQQTDVVDDAQAKGKRKGKRGGAPVKVGEIVGDVAPDATPSADGIVWGDDVPTPRPTVGATIRVPEGYASTITKVLGYDAESCAFTVVDSDEWQGAVYAHEPSGEWRVMQRMLDYADGPDGGVIPATPTGASETSETSEQPGDAGVSDYGAGVEQGGDDVLADFDGDAPDDSVNGEEIDDESRALAPDGAYTRGTDAETYDGGTDAGGEPVAVAAPPTPRQKKQRERNAVAAGVKSAAKKTPAKSGAKKKGGK